MKLLLTVLVLIVLPTAWLSLLAGRSIQARELLLDRRLETEAQQTLEQIGAETKHALEAVLVSLSDVVRETVLEGSDIRNLDEAITPLKGADALFQEVYLFLNPWGLIHPAPALSEHAHREDRYVLLAQELAFRLSRGEQRLFFAIGDRLYIFGLVQGETSLYAGYEVQQDAVLQRLHDLLRQYTTPHIAYRVLGVGRVQSAGGRVAEPGIEVRDTFSQELEQVPGPADFERDAQRSDVLVSGRLRAPFDFIEIGAIAMNAQDMYAARALQARLVRWSILLLAFILLSSAVLLILMARRQADQARLRSIFIAGLSHDIRTPVTAMRALAESLQQGRVDSAARKQQFLDTIVIECDRLQILIERVLLFFRQEQGGYHQKQAVDLVALCERVGNAFCARHRGRVDLKLELPENLHPTMWGDATALEQALHNLLENAWKYGRPMPDHPDVVVPVCVRLCVDAGCIWRRCLSIAVEDAGPGVGGSDRQRVFTRFYRGTSETVQQAGGIGLGLALVREIVRGHGGRVFIEDSAWGGARFVMRFKPFPFCVWSWRYFLQGVGMRVRR